ncbi:hypothetical protein NX794_24850 [Streptomyces sp. LP11]|uniref:Zinc-finger domain-containing protein n=1 Tax=Streptomyces pyxinicus TaxID=2970331 RepID=A0ABT2B7N2_9ACTN|nr:hypothetical protein [Streptomyces sp. LP11]MCS0604415.1 hypothetical protein [Streptomyces sp. LP11]
MTCEQGKPELAAYAVAALDAEESERFAGHLIGCPSCTADMNEVFATVAALRHLPAGELLGDWTHRVPALREAAVGSVRQEGGPAPAVAAVSVAAVPSGRRTGRWNWAFAAGVAGVILGLGGGPFLLRSPDRPAPTALPRPEGPTVLRATAADGVTAALQPESTGWGTQVLMDLSGVPGPQDCSLIAVSRDGTEQTAFTWHVPDGGYGLPASATDRLLATGGVGIATDRIGEYVVKATSGRTLLRIPVPEKPARTDS